MRTFFAFLFASTLGFGGVAAFAASNPLPPYPMFAAQPDLAVGPFPVNGPGYVLADTCVPGKPFIRFLILVANIGTLNSQPIDDDTAVTVTQTGQPWDSVGSKLGAIPAGGNQLVRMDLPARAGMKGAIDYVIEVNGKRWFDEYSFANNKMTITVTIPPGMCPR